MTTHPYIRLFPNKSAAPTVNDDETSSPPHEVGDFWIRTNGEVYQCTNPADGAAVWTQGGGGVTNLVDLGDVDITGINDGGLLQWSEDDSMFFAGESPPQNFTDLLDTPNTYSGQASKLVSVNSAANGLEFIDNDGWLSIAEAWTRTGNHSFTVPGDLTSRYAKGRFIKYQDGGGSDEFGVVLSSSHAAGTTTVNLIPNTSYAMAAATITNRYISYAANPVGFPSSFNYTPTHSRTGTNYTNLPAVSVSTWSPLGGGKLKFSQVWQQDATPGGTGNQQFTAPVTSATVFFGSAYNASTAVTQLAQIATGSNLCVLTNYAGATEVTASQFYVCGGIIDF